MRQYRASEIEAVQEAELEPEFDLRAILDVLRRHLRLILGTVLLAVAATGLGLFAIKPVYTASTLILVDPSRKDLLDPAQQASNAGSDNARVESEVELVRSETTLLRAIDALDLIGHPEFGVGIGLLDQLLSLVQQSEPALPTGEAAMQGVIANLRGALSVQRRGLTYLISVQVRSLQPADAARIANGVAAAYIDEQLEAKIGSTLEARDIIQGRIAEASAAVQASEEAFDAYIAENIETISLETGRTDLLEIGRELSSIELGREEAARLVQLADTSLGRRDWEQLSAALRSEAVEALESQRAALSARLADTEGEPEVAFDLEAELARLDAELDAAARAELGVLREDVAAAQTRASELRQQLRRSVLDADLPAHVLTSIYELQQSAEIARTQYETLLARLRELDAQAYLQVPDSRVVSEALPPSSPSFPNPPLILAIAAMAATGLGLALAFLLENYVGGFTSAAQMQAVLRTPATASIPRERAVRSLVAGEPGSVADNVTRAPLSLFAEAMRRLRMSLDQSVRRHRSEAHGRSGTVVMVASAAPGEGKTTIALSLARAYAVSGRSTLLIDCDLRKPSVHRQLGLAPSNGLLDYLARGQGDGPSIASFMTTDESSGAQIIVGSRRSDIPTDELIASRTFARLIDAARQNFEVVVLDTPPVGPVVDGLHLAPLADAILFVIRWASTSQQEARAAIAALSDAKRPDTEVIAALNQQERTQGGYAGKYAGYYTEA